MTGELNFCWCRSITIRTFRLSVFFLNEEKSTFPGFSLLFYFFLFIYYLSAVSASYQASVAQIRWCEWLSATWQEGNFRLRAHAGKARLYNWLFFFKSANFKQLYRQTERHSPTYRKVTFQKVRRKSVLSAGMVKYVCRLRTRESNWNPDLNTSEPDVCGFVHHSITHIENPTRCPSISKFISYLYEAQHVSGGTSPIMRSLKLH
jgi:hypothetical protein